MTLHGRLVEYLENGRFICALVQNDNDGTRLRLLNQDQRETNLPHDRIIHISPKNISSRLSREEIMSILHKTSQQREILAESIDLHEVWELVSEKPEENFEVNFLASLFFGNDPTDDQTAAFLRAIIANRLYFKYKSGKIHVHSPETVTQIKLKQDLEKEQDDFITDNSKFIEWIWQNGKIPADWKERERALQILRD